MIRAVIFDCFGVLYRDNSSLLYDAVPVDKYQALQDIIHATDHGYLTRDEYYAQVADIANTTPEKIKAIDHRQHSRDEDMIQFTQTLKPQYKIGLLSNIDHDTMQRMFPEPMRSELFDMFVVSGDVGVTKPAAEIFHIAADTLGLRPEECVMIDDLEKNVTGAQMAGMQALQFISRPQLEKELSQLLLEPANA
jgi:HAD superfamily hydrolase (TIGR01509 family)